jgi:hypothetical protein
MNYIDTLNRIADILVEHRGSLDTSELTRLDAAHEIIDAVIKPLIEASPPTTETT